jgi:hypothetical protein
VKVVSKTLPEFWRLYDALPRQVQQQASRQYATFMQNPRHPSLQLKPVSDFWSVRVNDSYRALAFREGNVYTWFWIGSHDEYEREINAC